LEFLDNYGLYTRPSPDDKEDANVGVCVFPDEVLEPTKYSEGAGHTVAVNAYERDPQARRDCIRHYGADCCICGFNFGATYGEDGEGYIHVHHLVPLSEIGEEYIVDPIKDLRPVCPNCHAALHLGGTCRTIEELQALVERHGGT
jgi:predicted HNH restriction endonuclease